MVGSSSLSTPATFFFIPNNFVFQVLFNNSQVCHYYAMSINQRQYQQLSEMGISLWQHRPLAFQNDSSTQLGFNQHDSADKINYLKQDVESLAALTKKTFFTDLLLTLELSIGEVTAQKDHLNLGLFNWFFYTDENKKIAIHCADNKLISPSIEIIRKSPALKKQLWQTITTNLL
jgi:DNA polymerase III psi subunit